MSRQPVYILRVITARTALLACSLLLLLCSSFLSAGGWFLVDKLDGQLTDFQRLVLYFHIMSFLFVGGSSLVGIYYATTKKAPFFAALLFGHIIFGIASGALCLHLIFTSAASPERISSCSTLIPSASWEGFCRHPGLMKCLALGVFEFVWMLEILAIYVAVRFSAELQEEENLKALCSPKEDRESFFC